MIKDMENIFNIIAELGGSDERLGQNTSVFIKAPLLKDETRARAVPDVPELVRYSPKDYKQGMCFDSAGEYVRYDQAAEMLSAVRRQALEEAANLTGNFLMTNTGMSVVKIVELSANIRSLSDEPVKVD